ncbi:MAG: hypothetical protein WC069_06955, partial [Candidatus Shapirobacteria bacterium]
GIHPHLHGGLTRHLRGDFLNECSGLGVCRLAQPNLDEHFADCVFAFVSHHLVPLLNCFWRM